MQLPLDRALILELRSLLAEIHEDHGEHSVMVGLTQSVKDAKEKLKSMKHEAFVNGVNIGLMS